MVGRSKWLWFRQVAPSRIKFGDDPGDPIFYTDSDNNMSSAISKWNTNSLRDSWIASGFMPIDFYFMGLHEGTTLLSHLATYL